MQDKVDDLVSRIRPLVTLYGGQSETLKEVVKWYTIFSRFPEWGSLTVLEAEVEKVEALTKEKS